MIKVRERNYICRILHWMFYLHILILTLFLRQSIVYYLILFHNLFIKLFCFCRSHSFQTYNKRVYFRVFWNHLNYLIIYYVKFFVISAFAYEWETSFLNADACHEFVVYRFLIVILFGFELILVACFVLEEGSEVYGIEVEEDISFYQLVGMPGDAIDLENEDVSQFFELYLPRFHGRFQVAFLAKLPKSGK